jgi:hypothetical protein
MALKCVGGRGVSGGIASRITNMSTRVDLHSPTSILFGNEPQEANR